MRERRFLALVAVGLIAAAVALGAVVAAQRDPDEGKPSEPPRGPYRGSEPPPGLHAPDFTLRDYRGRTVKMRDLRGLVVLLSFVDTKCKEKCPVVTSVMAAAVRRMSPTQRAEIAPLLMSVDPSIDTPRSIHRFLARRRALSLTYLIGPVKRLRPIWKAYGIVAAADTANADIHSTDVRVFDRNGLWVSTQHAGVDLAPQNLAHDAILALRRSSP